MHTIKNLYYSGTSINWIYKSDGKGSIITQNNDVIFLSIFPYGLSGDVVAYDATKHKLIVTETAIGVLTSLPTHPLHVNGDIRIDGTTSTTATAGNATLPANPVGFLVVNIGGTDYKVPYYAV